MLNKRLCLLIPQKLKHTHTLCSPESHLNNISSPVVSSHQRKPAVFPLMQTCLPRPVGLQLQHWDFPVHQKTRQTSENIQTTESALSDDEKKVSGAARVPSISHIVALMKLTKFLLQRERTCHCTVISRQNSTRNLQQNDNTNVHNMLLCS